MYVKLRRGGSEQTFSFWAYGETSDLKPGSGLFVAQTGVAFNHHFVLPTPHPGYQFGEGLCSIVVFARVAGNPAPIKLSEFALTLSRADAVALAGQHGILFELEPDTGRYSGHTQEHSIA